MKRSTRRFNAQTPVIRYRGRNIADVLEMTVAEARAFFSKHRKISKILETLVAVGLGYVQLGQPQRHHLAVKHNESNSPQIGETWNRAHSVCVG